MQKLDSRFFPTLFAFLFFAICLLLLAAELSLISGGSLEDGMPSPRMLWAQDVILRTRLPTVVCNAVMGAARCARCVFWAGLLIYFSRRMAARARRMMAHYPFIQLGNSICALTFGGHSPPGC